ncbi:uncharacterized protein [Parasteatoda tepidariorum]|uniref:uncharacterized protein isoform X1 n=1 Tax=Parasteatoda tepidariorum TaxID=114398 RepID=UPI001C7289D0|nr:uncharacterized protein LOC107442332 isoform X1 [Parasteatoda tepidariorum]
MQSVWIILVFCVASISAFGMKKTCEKLTEEIGDAFDKCNALFPEEQLQLINGCKKEAVPDALTEDAVKSYPYLAAACKDRSKFSKFSQCMGGLMLRGEVTKVKFLNKQMAENKKCYRMVEEKYDIGPS